MVGALLLVAYDLFRPFIRDATLSFVTPDRKEKTFDFDGGSGNDVDFVDDSCETDGGKLESPDNDEDIAEIDSGTGEVSADNIDGEEEFGAPMEILCAFWLLLHCFTPLFMLVTALCRNFFVAVLFGYLRAAGNTFAVFDLTSLLKELRERNVLFE